MRTSLAVALLAATLATPIIVRAQTCSGNTPFTSGVMRAGGAAAIADGSTTFGAEFAGGEPIGLYGTAYFSQTSFSGHGGRAAGSGGSLGFSVDVRKTVQVCPVISILHTDYPNVTTGTTTVQSSMNGVGVGVLVGMTRAVTPAIDLIPFVGADFTNSSTTARVGSGSADESENYAHIAAGFAVVFGRSWTVRPRAAFALGRAGGNSVLRPATEYGIGITMNFWGVE